METVREVDSILIQVYLMSYKRYSRVAATNNNFWTWNFSCHMDPPKKGKNTLTPDYHDVVW